jgi:hypothetical protein
MTDQRRALLLVVLIAGSSCSDSTQSAANDAGATTPSPCPDQPPENAATCTEVGLQCLYERCETQGLVRAICTPASGEVNVPQRWAVTAEACSSHDCLNTTCGAGTVCAANAGGTVTVACRPHTCGDGPLTCACVCGGLECSPGDTTPTGAGVLFTCVTCAECP